MKKIICLLLSFITIAALSGCGIKGNLELPGEQEGQAFEK